MATSLGDLAALVGGRLLGDAALMISGAATLADVQAGQLTLLDSPEKIKKLASSPAAAAIVPDDCDDLELPAIAVDDVHQAFATVVCHFRPPRTQPRIGISPAAHISPTARLGDDVDVYPGASIGDDVEIGPGSTIHAGVHIMAGCKLGPQVTIFPNAVLYEGTLVGPRCLIHAGAVLGAYGFGYKTVGGRHELSAQLGYVKLGPDVEVGANSTIDRGTYGPTLVGEGTKIDNQVMIAHNCRLGRHNMICSQVGIAGSTTTGDYVVMAGQVGVRDHVHIGTGAVLGAMAGIINDVPDGSRMIGVPATPERDQKLKQAAFTKLPEMRRQLKALQAQVDRLASSAPNDNSQAA